MTHLHRLSDISSSHQDDFRDTAIYNPVGATAYLSSGQQIGTIRDALVDDDYGRLRYLLVDQNGGDVNGAIIVPIGLARIEDNGVYFDSLSSGQLSAMHRYSDDEEYTFDLQSSDERVLRGEGAVMDSSSTATAVAASTGMEASTASVAAMGTTARAYNYRDEDTSDRMFKTPDRLQLLEERLMVNKERYLAGSVQVSKRVETHQETVAVPVQREEVVIERHPVTDPRPVQGDVAFAADGQTIRVDLEAERADVSKQAFVTEEVEIGKRTTTTQQSVTETVGREVLEVNQTGDVKVNRDEDNR